MQLYALHEHHVGSPLDRQRLANPRCFCERVYMLAHASSSAMMLKQQVVRWREAGVENAARTRCYVEWIVAHLPWRRGISTKRGSAEWITRGVLASRSLNRPLALYPYTINGRIASSSTSRAITLVMLRTIARPSKIRTFARSVCSTALLIVSRLESISCGRSS
jgi:hypothetical protein